MDLLRGPLRARSWRAGAAARSAWGYGHIPLFGAVVAVGAGLHVAAFLVEDKTKLDVLDTLLTTAIPVAIYVLGIFVLYAYLTETIDPFHYLLIGLSFAMLGAAVAMAAAGVSIEWCLLALSLVPWITVVGYELVGHRHNARMLADLAVLLTGRAPFLASTALMLLTNAVSSAADATEREPRKRPLRFLPSRTTT